MNLKFVYILVCVCCVVLLSGCTQVPEDNETPIEAGFVAICIRDRPSENFSHVNVTFSEVKLHSNTTGWVSFLASPKTIDFIELHLSNLSEQLGLEEVVLEEYTKLWIVVDNVTGVLAATGETVYLDVPSDTLKIQHLFEMVDGNNTITVDINLDESILVYGGGEKYKLLPVISEMNVSYGNGTRIRFRDHERIINHKNGTEVRVQSENTLRNMVGNRKPVIDIVVNGSRGKHVMADRDEMITFDASETFDIDMDSLLFLWDFDDGIAGTESVVSHSYSESGTYHVSLMVSDGFLEETVVIIVTVRQGGGHGPG